MLSRRTFAPPRENHVVELVRSQGDYGATSAELAARLGKPLRNITGQLAQLKARGALVETGQKRSGCTVLRAPREE